MEVPGTGHSSQQNAGAYTKVKYAIQPQTATAAAGDGTFLDGEAINRVDPNVALAAIPAVPVRAVLTSGENVVFTRVVQHREDSTQAWEDYLSADQQPGDVTVRGADGGTALLLDVADPQNHAALGDGAIVSGEKWNVDLSAAKQEIRIRVRPNFSRSGVDTVNIAGSVVLAGYDTNPPA